MHRLTIYFHVVYNSVMHTQQTLSLKNRYKNVVTIIDCIIAYKVSFIHSSNTVKKDYCFQFKIFQSKKQ